MPLIMNCLDKQQQVCVGGNYFSFKAGQIRELNSSDIANHIARSGADQGFVALSGPTTSEDGDGMSTADWTKTEAGKAEIAERKKEGIANYCNHLRTVADNINSVRADLERKNIKGEVYPYLGRNSGELRALEELAIYKKAGQDADEAEHARIKQLEKQLDQARK